MVLSVASPKWTAATRAAAAPACTSAALIAVSPDARFLMAQQACSRAPVWRARTASFAAATRAAAAPACTSASSIAASPAARFTMAAHACYRAPAWRARTASRATPTSVDADAGGVRLG